MPNAIITGATHGIGAAIARKMASEKCSLIICARNSTELTTLKTELEQLGSPCVLTQSVDLGNKEAAISFARFALNSFSEVDILVNNAGIFIPGDLCDEPDGQLEAMLQLNLIAPYAITRIIAPKMKQQQSGHIFNICSVASLKAYPMGGSYSISKYALLGFSENLRQELMHHKIKVTAICPGATDSRSWADADVPKDRIMPAYDIAEILWTSYKMSGNTNLETIVMRPQLGDL